MQNDPLSHGLWEKSAPPAPVTDALTQHLQADVVVIGGGFTGLSTALHLAQQGVRVVVLEAVEIGFGGSGRNVGLVNAGMWVMPDDLPAALGEVYGERLLTELGNGPSLVFDLIARHGIDCEARHEGTLHCAVGQAGLAELENRVMQWSARGAPVSLLSAERTAAMTGTEAYTGSLLDMRAGTIQPLAYVRGLAHAAIAAGASIHTASPVQDASYANSRWTVKTTGGSVSADWVVTATNAYTRGPWPQLRSELMMLPYFNLATAPLSAVQRAHILPGGQGIWDTQSVLTSLRADRAGRLVFGSVGALRGVGRDIHHAWGRRALARLFPELGKVRFEHQWYGNIGMTTDSLPRLHRLAPRAMSLSGYNGRGIAPGTVFGRMMAQYITGALPEQDLPLPVSDVRAHAFRGVKETFYEVGAGLSHLVSARR
ncbi:FAD-binding oxidoreductase [Pigmentiphaga aceris]|uniref:FAD-binding oxidoreductase n=2 Tax=Pigmentiphaga aceris TaxID=1940612 RepID=A0A5C0B785_9BURK|nr:FAD-binding oxidoreductase [Pigmentiphaga aceris]